MDQSRIDREVWNEFANLVNETQASLRAFVRMLGVRPDSVDDMAQETYVVAFQQYEQFDPSRNFLVWLRGIARNIVRNEKRKDARRRRIIGELLTEDLCDSFMVQPGTLDTRIGEVSDALSECMEHLSVPHRDLIRRRYESDENATVLGREMKRSSEAVRQSLFKIRMSLQRCIEHKIGEVVL